jgi:hypothetical protein
MRRLTSGHLAILVGHAAVEKQTGRSVLASESRCVEVAGEAMRMTTEPTRKDPIVISKIMIERNLLPVGEEHLSGDMELYVDPATLQEIASRLVSYPNSPIEIAAFDIVLGEPRTIIIRVR